MGSLDRGSLLEASDAMHARAWWHPSITEDGLETEDIAINDFNF